ncbi:hypothetical protein MNBD_PLANCTO02-3427 [hydrothermal vent metagenome]|uniref:Uncharacterized protein n=1 Tax=hydrothermal vent metagenome TaxID=652676 RepID=A0A3B1DBE5_9ZZZZ
MLSLSHQRWSVIQTKKMGFRGVRFRMFRNLNGLACRTRPMLSEDAPIEKRFLHWLRWGEIPLHSKRRESFDLVYFSLYGLLSATSKECLLAYCLFSKSGRFRITNISNGGVL